MYYGKEVGLNLWVKMGEGELKKKAEGEGGRGNKGHDSKELER